MPDNPIYYVEEDGHGEPTLWSHYDTPELSFDPRVVLRRSDLGAAARDHWDEIVARVVGGGLTATQQWELDKAARR